MVLISGSLGYFVIFAILYPLARLRQGFDERALMNEET
jgi:hypothetical protein